jgi:hypothetical protein
MLGILTDQRVYCGSAAPSLPGSPPASVASRKYIDGLRWADRPEAGVSAQSEYRVNEGGSDGGDLPP